MVLNEGLKPFFVVGLLFPLHIILGVACVPALLYYLWCGSAVTKILLLCYLPLFLWPASTAYPGWKALRQCGNGLTTRQRARNTLARSRANSRRRSTRAHHFVGSHPHGTLIFQRMFWRSSLLDPHFPSSRIRMLGASVLFRIPIVREMTLFFGAVDASRSNCERLLKKGCSVVVYPGGIDEMPLQGDGPNSAVRLRTRTGFIRMAIKYGVPVLPSFCFGELEAVSAVSPLPSGMAKWLQKTFRMSTTCFVGRWNLFLPRRVPFTLCFGTPIPTKKVEGEKEMDAEVERVHLLYKAELKAVYEANKQACGYGKRELVFTCERR